MYELASMGVCGVSMPVQASNATEFRIWMLRVRARVTFHSRRERVSEWIFWEIWPPPAMPMSQFGAGVGSGGLCGGEGAIDRGGGEP